MCVLFFVRGMKNYCGEDRSSSHSILGNMQVTILPFWEAGLCLCVVASWKCSAYSFANSLCSGVWFFSFIFFSSRGSSTLVLQLVGSGLGEISGIRSSTAWFERQSAGILLDLKSALKITFALTKEACSCGLDGLEAPSCCSILLFRSSLPMWRCWIQSGMFYQALNVHGANRTAAVMEFWALVFGFRVAQADLNHCCSSFTPFLVAVASSCKSWLTKPEK